MGVIKSANAPASLAPFSMRDIESYARSLLLAARRQAEQLIAQAQAESTHLKTSACEEGAAEGHRKGLELGMAEGKKTGHEQALAEHRVKLSQVVQTFTTAAADLNLARQKLDADAAAGVVDLATAVARRITHRQAALDPGVLTANLSQASRLVVRAADVRIAVHPSQADFLKSELPALKLQWPTLTHVDLVSDPTVAPGGCRLYTAGGVIDADLNLQLDRIIAQLSPESAPAEAIA